jgi:hypothetical protein
MSELDACIGRSETPVVATCDIRSPNEPFENTFPRFSRLADETVGA